MLSAEEKKIPYRGGHYYMIAASIGTLVGYSSPNLTFAPLLMIVLMLFFKQQILKKTKNMAK